MQSLIILRGLPGSGKSTLAGVLCENKKYPIFSVDDFFTNPVNGEYKFEFDKNHLAYKQCEQKTREALHNGIEKIFVANTFTLDWEIEPYFKMAKKFNCMIHILTVENYHNSGNIHSITQEQIKKMAEKYKVTLF
jgi:predicted kinase